MSRAKKNYTQRESIQGRHWETVIYVESKDYDYELLLNRLPYYWETYWYILHDKDFYTEKEHDEYVIDHDGKEPDWKIGDLKKAHYHVYGSTGTDKGASPCVLGRAAVKFGVMTHMVRPIKNLNKAVQYLVHANDKGKYQYSMDEIITNDEKLGVRMNKVESSSEKAQMLLDYIMNGCNSISDLSYFAINNNLWDELRRGQHIYTALMRERNED